MIHPFGIFLIIIIIFLIVIKRKDSFIFILAITIFVEINNIAGYFFKIGLFEIGYTDFLQLVLSLISVYRCKRIKKIKFINLLIVLLFCSIGSFISLIFHPHTYIVDTYKTSWDQLLFFRTGSRTILHVGLHSIMIEIRLIIWGLIGLVVFDDRRNNEKITNIIIKLTNLHIYFALFELATKTLFKSNIATELRNIIFGLGQATYSSLSTRGTGSGFSIYGFTRESSHFATAMFLFAFILLISKKYKNNILQLGLSIILMCSSMSFSSVMYIMTLLVVYFIVNGFRITKRTMILILFIMFVVIFGIYKIFNNSYYRSRIYEFYIAFQSITNGFIGNDITSSKVRLYSIFESIKLFFSRPVFGLGLGTTSCYSGLASILVNVGIVGFLSWINYCFCGISIKKYQIKYIVLTIVLILLPNALIGELGMMYSVYILYLFRLVFYSITN